MPTSNIYHTHTYTCVHTYVRIYICAHIHTYYLRSRIYLHACTPTCIPTFNTYSFFPLGSQTNGIFNIQADPWHLQSNCRSLLGALIKVRMARCVVDQVPCFVPGSLSRSHGPQFGLASVLRALEEHPSFGISASKI